MKTSRTHRARFRPVPQLREFLKRFGTGIEARARRIAFAGRLGSSESYLTQLCLGFRQASMDMAVKIERASYGQVRVEDLLPSDHWAYLANRLPGSSTGPQTKPGKKSGSSVPGKGRKLSAATVAI